MRRKLLAAAFALLVLSGCGGDDTPNGPIELSIVGEYDLITVEGESLPYTLFDILGERLECLSGSIDIRASGTISSEVEMRLTTDGVSETFSETDTGTWSSSGSSVTLFWDEGCTDNATVLGDRLTLLDCELDLLLVFEK